MTDILFLAFLALVVLGLAAAALIYLPRVVSLSFLFGLGLWLVYVGVMSWSGFVANPGIRPPPAFLVVLPVVFFIFLVLAFLPVGRRVAVAFPLWLLVGAQSFRVGVELLLHRLWTDGFVPRLMTFEGGNVDIFVGLSAPLIAWLATKGRFGITLALVWNVVGLAALANIVVRAALTAPGPLKILESEVPNLALGVFPYTFIAAFFAPLALALHVLAIRCARAARAAVDPV